MDFDLDKLCARIGSFRIISARGIHGQVFTFQLKMDSEHSISPDISKAYQESHYQSEGVKEKHAGPGLSHCGLRAGAPDGDCVVAPLKSLGMLRESISEVGIIPYATKCFGRKSLWLRM